MKVERFGKRHAFVPSLIGLAMLAGPSVASSQQQPQGEGQGQGQAEGQAAGQRQGDVQIAAAPGDVQPSQQPMIWNEVRIVKVKGDRVGEFEGLLKELGAAMREQDAPSFNVWQVAFGEQNTYHIVAQLQSFGALAEMAQNPPMEPIAWANWVNRIESTIDSQELAIAQVHTDLSIMPQGEGGAQGQGQAGQAQGQAGQAQGQPPAQGQAQSQRQAQSQPQPQTDAETPELLILMSQTLLPGKRQEYQAWLRDEMLPALRQTDIMGVVSNEMAFGSEDRTWVFAVPVASWEELDQPMPLYRSMGQEAAEQLLARGDSMVDRSETIVLRTRPELSSEGGQAEEQLAGQPQQQGQQVQR